MSQDQPRKIVGIDLGTTYSAIAHFDDHDKADIIPNSDNERITPSVILFEDDEVIVGKIAKNQAVSNPENVVQFVKRQMGESDWSVAIQGRDYTPEVLSAIILKRIISDAEEAIGETITDAVITVPAYFNDIERKASTDAGKIAGINILGIINEPTAAVLSYGMDRIGEKKTVLVYDLGGGTFDVSIVEIDGSNVKVLATAGERRLGGKDWDDTLANYVAEEFEDQHGIDPRLDAEANQDLAIKCEDAKKALSRKPRSKVFAQCGGKSLKIEITRDQFEGLTQPLLEQTETYLNVVLEKAKLTWDNIDSLLLVGGSTRMPQVPEMMARVSGKSPEKGVNPDECVALGAVYWAAILIGREKQQLRDKIDAGDASEEEIEAVKVAHEAIKETVPEEIVGMLEGVVVDNVNSHSLGIVMLTAGGEKKNFIMIPEQTPLPTKVTKYFGTYQENQQSVEIKIVEGESADPEDCTRIGTVLITDLPPNRPKGSRIAVTYEYDESGRIHISARDQQSGVEVRSEMHRDADLTDADIAQHGADVQTLVDEGIAGFQKTEGFVDAADASLAQATGDYSAAVADDMVAPGYDQVDQYQAGYDTGQYAEGQDTGQYQQGYDTGQYAEGQYVEGQYPAEGQYQEGYDTGQYAEGQYVEGQYPAEGQYQEGYDTGQYAEGQYVEGQYQEGYDTGQYAEGQYVEGQYPAEGQYQEGYDTGQYPAEGQYQEGYDTGQYAEGQYAEGQYAEGQYQEGYDTGQYVEGQDTGQYVEGQYQEGYDTGQYAEGQYAEGQYAPEGQYQEGYDTGHVDGANAGYETGQYATGDYTQDEYGNQYTDESYAEGDYGTANYEDEQNV